MYKLYFSLLLAVTLVGCASQPPLSQVANQAGTFEAHEHIDVASAPTYRGPSSIWSDAVKESIGGGLVGAVVSTGANVAEDISMNAAQTRLFNAMQDNNIDLQNMLDNKYQAALANSEFADYVSPKQHPYDLELSVFDWGLATSNGFSSKMSLILAIRLAVLDPQKQVVWSYSAGVNEIAKFGPKYSLEELENDPALLASTFDSAMQHLVAELFTNIESSLAEPIPES